MIVNPEISVIVPVYKAEQFLPKCIESILTQTFRDFELLLIDDGSPDSSGVICDEYATKDGRIRVIHKKNEGVSVARNTGLKNAGGKWIAFIDSDDWVSDTYLLELYTAIKSPDGLVVQGINFISDKNKINETLKFEDCIIEKDSLSEAFSEKQLQLYGYPSSKLYNLSVIKKHDILFDPGISYAEDMIFMFHYILYVSQIVFVSGANYYYQISTNGLSKKYSSFESENKTYQKMIVFIKELKARGFSDNQLQKLSEHAVFLLLRSLYCMYRPMHIIKIKERLQILNKITSDEILSIQQSNRKKIIPFRVAEFLLTTKHFWEFDMYCRILFFLRYKSKYFLGKI